MTMPDLKMPNIKKLAFIGIAALGLNICLANTNPLTDTSKHKYHPQNRDELVELLRDKNIKLDTIDTSKITDMSLLFANISSYRCNFLESREIELYKQNCENAARGRKDFSGIETWDVSNAVDMFGMFWGAASFNQPLESWDVSKVKDLRRMFRNTEFFNQNLNSWKVNKGADTHYMFKNSPLESNPPKWYKK